MYLNSLAEFEENRKRELPEEVCPTETLEEEMCDEERYKDMYEDIKRVEGIFSVLDYVCVI